MRRNWIKHAQIVMEKKQEILALKSAEMSLKEMQRKLQLEAIPYQTFRRYILRFFAETPDLAAVQNPAQEVPQKSAQRVPERPAQERTEKPPQALPRRKRKFVDVKISSDKIDLNPHNWKEEYFGSKKSKDENQNDGK